MSGLYDVTLAPGASGNIAVLGSYAKVSSAPAGAVQLRLDGGEAFSLQEGQGIRLPDGCTQFRDVTIKNTAAIAQTIVVFIGDTRFEDTRITGTVSVVDGGKARTISSQAFVGYNGNTSGGATFTVVQLRNPTTTKRLVVKRVTLSTSIAGIVQMSRHAVALADGPYNVYSKLLAAPAAMSALIYRDLLAATPGNQMFSLQLVANTPFVMVLEEPIVIPPGESLCFTMTVFSATFTAIYEGFEEPNV